MKSNAELVENAWRTRTFDAQLAQWAAEQPDKKFFRCGDVWTTYKEAYERGLAVAGGLQARGVNKGDRVAVISNNTDEAVLGLIGLALLGAIAVPLNVYLKGDFLKFQLADCQASALLTDGDGLASVVALDGNLPDLKTVVLLEDAPTDLKVTHGWNVSQFADLLKETHNFSPPTLSVSDPICIIYSSGTTGLPKGCVCSHGYYLASSIPAIECEWFGHDDVLFTAFPLFHTAGYALILGGALQAGASVCLEKTFSASRFLERIREVGATTAHGVGPMAMAILATLEKSDDADNSLRRCTWIPLPEAQQIAFEKRFGVEVIAAAYGQSEATPIAILSSKDSRLHREALGKPVAHMDVMIVDENDTPMPTGEIGEIVVRPQKPETIYQGYWGRPEATIEATKNLWHHTGDLGTLDRHGFLHFSDRKKDMIRRRGENVSSFELEAAIRQHPAIANVAAFAVPSPMGEDDIKICVQYNDNEETNPSALFEFLAERIPYFAIPKYVEIVPALPINANGRVMKHLLREAGAREQDWDFEKLGLTLDKQKRRG